MKTSLPLFAPLTVACVAVAVFFQSQVPAQNSSLSAPLTTQGASLIQAKAPVDTNAIRETVAALQARSARAVPRTLAEVQSTNQQANAVQGPVLLEASEVYALTMAGKAQSRVAAPSGALMSLAVNNRLLSVDFAGNAKTGFAAIGQTANDYWNSYIMPGLPFGTLQNILWSDQTASPVDVTVANGPGQWGNPLCVDPMYASYVYAFNSGETTVTVAQLPNDTYDIYVYAVRASDLGAPVVELERAGVTLWTKGTTLWGDGWYSSYWDEHEQYVRFRNISVNNQPITLHMLPDPAGYASISGMQIVPSSAIPPEQPAITKLLNVDFAGCSSPLKTGFGAVGLNESDFWNSHCYQAQQVSTVPNLQWSDQTASGASLTVLNAPGAWGNALPDPMLRSYIYSFDGGNITMTLSGLPVGICDVYLYGHTDLANDNAVFELWSDDVNWGMKGTSLVGDGPMYPAWEVGQQYVLFKEITVTTGKPVIIHAKHTTLGYNNVSGLQLAYTGDVDSDGDGLPDGWERRCFNNLDQIASADSDGDGLTNLREYQLGTDPTRADSDADGLSDLYDFEKVWIEDCTPQGGYEDGRNEGWNWVDSWYDGDGWGGQPIYPHSGRAWAPSMHISENVPGQMHQHRFVSSIATMRPEPGDVLYTYVNVDSSYVPSEVMLEWYVIQEDGNRSWEHRAYWGANLINAGQDGTGSRYPLGELPAAGQWVRLEVPASVVGLEGKIVEGMAFTLHSGRAAWDSVGTIKLDRNGNGIPDAWEWENFGGLQPAEGDYDGDGINNLDEYLGGTNPNDIQFTILYENDHIRTSPAVGSVQVHNGAPSELAVLLNSTNFADAQWASFHTGFSQNLPFQDGAYDVWVGLRGHSTKWQPVWRYSRVFLDSTPPRIAITSPLAVSISCPMMQFQGFSPEPLAGIYFDVTNAAGYFTNMQGFVIAQVYDTNSQVFTTNLFQCFDIDLTNGENTVCLRAVDLAGNVGVTNFTYTLLPDTVAPMIGLQWPLDGMAVCGDNFTVSGQVDDPTARVLLTMTPLGGQAVTLEGIVERNGKFWVEGVPLVEGSSECVLAAIDAWNNSSSTNFTIRRSEIGLNIAPVDGQSLYRPTVDVAGAIDDPSYSIWVNGIPAANTGQGSWQVPGVPVSAGGTATFIVYAYPPGHDGEPEYAISARADAEKPARVYVSADVQNYQSHEYRRTDDIIDGLDQISESNSDTHYDHGWTENSDSKGSWFYKSDAPYSDSLDWQWPPSFWPDLALGSYVRNDNGNVTAGASSPPIIETESCKASYPTDLQYSYHPNDYERETVIQTLKSTWDRNAQTTLKLYTGGKAIPKRQNLFVIYGSASEILGPALPPYSAMGDGLRTQAIPPSDINIGDIGKLGSDGRRYIMLPDDATKDVTARTSRGFYTFRVDFSKHRPRLEANGVDLDVQTPKFSVGQKVVLRTSFDPEPPGIVSVSAVWNLPGEYRNAKQYPFGMDYYLATCHPHYVRVVGQLPLGVLTPCTYYLIEDSLLYEESTGAWWISDGSKKVGSSKTIGFSNGQELTAIFLGRFEILSPTVSISNILPRDFTGSWLAGVFLGDYFNGDKGMIYMVDFCSAFSGTGAITQLIKADYSSPGPSFSDYRLDGVELYSADHIKTISDPGVQKNISFDDYPGNPLGSRLKADFKDYVRFMPDGDDNIYATIGLIQWSVFGEVTIYDTWPHRETPDPEGPTASIEFPTWDQSYP